MKLNRLILILGVDAVRHRDKVYSEDETFTYKTGQGLITQLMKDSLLVFDV
jgi:hypothetical protein